MTTQLPSEVPNCQVYSTNLPLPSGGGGLTYSDTISITSTPVFTKPDNSYMSTTYQLALYNSIKDELFYGLSVEDVQQLIITHHPEKLI